MWFSAGASAQRLPGTILPGQIGQQFQTERQPQAVEPTTGARRELPLPEAPEGAEKITAVIDSVNFDGATVFTQEELESMHDVALGREVSLADLYRIAAQVTAEYRRAGYVISRVVIPEQEVENATVRMTVLEGFIDRVQVRGDVAGNSQRVQQMLDRITDEKPVSIDTIERYMLLVNDLPGVYAGSTLIPGGQLGSSTLVVDVTRTSTDLLLGIDNRGSEFLGPVRGRVELNFNNLFGTYTNAGLFVSTTGSNDELHFASLSLGTRLGASGLQLFGNASVVRSEPEQGVQLRGLETDSETAVVGLRYPLYRTRSQNFSLNSSFTYYDGGVTVGDIELNEDRVRTLRVGATWDLFDSLGGVNIFDLTYSFGLDIFNATNPSEDNVSRRNAELNFRKFNLYAARLQSLGPGWSLLLALNGQYALDGVLNPEGFGYGGELFGRGYDPSELFADSGAGLKTELRYLADFGRGMTAEPYAFWDIGYVEDKEPVFGETFSASAASAGAGVRLSLGKSLSGYIEVAKPLTREVFAEGNKDARFYGGISYSF
jgi:hemolysin activation/secretion protein